MFRATIGRLAAVTALLGLATAGFASPSAAQTCRIGDGSGSNWTAPAQVPGSVVQFGDLKIRIATIDSTATSATLDIKTPGGVLADQYFRYDEPRRFTICGQDVTIAYTGLYRIISVSVF